MHLALLLSTNGKNGLTWSLLIDKKRGLKPPFWTTPANIGLCGEQGSCFRFFTGTQADHAQQSRTEQPKGGWHRYGTLADIDIDIAFGRTLIHNIPEKINDVIAGA